MSVFHLWRMAEGATYTIGRIEDEERHQVCVTTERPWVDKNNDGLGDPKVSRIPSGTYTCRRDMHGKSGPHPYEVWEICDVPGRSEIHIHIGNDPMKDSIGCPLVGSAFGAQGFVTKSRDAFDRWMAATSKYKEITLHVHDIPPRGEP
jgi:hypothetical protein